MVGEVGQPQRAGFADEEAEDPVATRQVTDRLVLFGGQPTGDELHQVLAVGSQHPEGAVLRVDQLARRAHDPRQDLRQVQACRDGHDRVQEGTEALLGFGRGLGAPTELIQQVVQVECGGAGPALFLSR